MLRLVPHRLPYILSHIKKAKFRLQVLSAGITEEEKTYRACDLHCHEAQVTGLYLGSSPVHLTVLATCCEYHCVNKITEDLKISRFFIVVSVQTILHSNFPA